MRVAVTGAAGMLGQDVVQALDEAGWQVTPLPRSALDVTDPEAAANAVGGAHLVVNCAAWTAVDDAESQEAQAFSVNAVGAATIAWAADQAGARLVHISTDYVFAGDASSPYAEDAPTAPRSAYGRTKLAGEWAVQALCPNHLLLRTAWLYGAGGGCFPKTMARLAGERDELSVVEDQVGQPTWTRDVADLMVRLLQSDAAPGTYHATSTGSTSWFGFAREVVAAAGHDREMVRPTDSAAFVRPAPRPAYSVLGHAALRQAGVDPIGPWDERWRAAAPSVLAVGP